jgi:predicted amidophosphoribosyltransferase
MAIAPRPGTKRHWLQGVVRAMAMDGHYPLVWLDWQRSVETQHHQLSAQARWQNMQQAFVWLRKVWPHEKQVDHTTTGIVVIDDITTTGATLFAAAQAIRTAGYTGPLTMLTLCYVPNPRQAAQPDTQQDFSPLGILTTEPIATPDQITAWPQRSTVF